MYKYGLATFLRPVPDGFEFAPDDWPLHITQVDTLEVGLAPNELDEKLRVALRLIPSLITSAESDDMFGPQKDILVTRLELVPELKDLHNIIVKILEQQKAIFKRPFLLKENFKPHMTVHGQNRINVGDKVVINEVSIIDKLPGGNPNLRRVTSTIKLFPR